MALIPLKLRPGMSRPGTKYDARGRWYDGNLVRWYEGSLQPIGGWAPLSTVAPAAGPIVLGKPVRGLLAWRDSTQMASLAMGTASQLWLFRGGVLVDITPAEFTPGLIHADEESGQYGAGPYGVGTYGFGAEGTSARIEAASWQLDSFGQALVACASSDGRLVWKLDLTTPVPAEQVPNAPTGCIGVVVTPERFVVALGADGDRRKVAWSDQENPAVWAPDQLNQAGDFVLTSAGSLLAGRRSRQETLLWTDVDLWAMRFIGGTFVYSFQQLGSACGAASRHAMTVVDGRAYWMGDRAFFSYDGTVRQIPCEVADYVFNSMNQSQISKVACVPNSQFGEITWYYPSAGSIENDSYVTYSYRGNHWTTGRLARTAGADSGVFGFPVAVDPLGQVYQHEIVGGAFTTPHGNPMVAYAESGPVEIGVGDNVMMVRQIVPDTDTLGSVQGRLYASVYPVEQEREVGPIPLANPTPVRMTGRQVRLRVEGAGSQWRVGTMRLEVVTGGRR